MTSDAPAARPKPPTPPPVPGPTGPKPGPGPAPGAVKRVVVFVQENHTVDNYFAGMAPWGANVATGWPVSPNPPTSDQPHDRHAYFEWLTHAITGAHVQFDTAAVLPYYLYLAITGSFLENHCSGFGTNSTPNHLILVGGQTPTLRNPPRAKAQPVWDLPSLPGLAQDNGLTWGGYTGRSHYPLGFYKQLQGSPSLAGSAQFVTDAKAGKLPQLCMVWHDSPLDEHPTSDVTLGMNTIWQAVDAVVGAGQWEETVFLLTWDDWGGYDDHVATPATEYTPDNVQLAFGPRIGLIMFGGQVKSGIDSRWCSHASITKTAMQLLGLPALGVPRVDTDGGLADLVDPALHNPPPPTFGTAIHLPSPPVPPPAPRPLPPHPTGSPQPVGPVILRGGSTLPAPNDAPVGPLPSPPTA